MNNPLKFHQDPYPDCCRIKIEKKCFLNSSEKALVTPPDGKYLDCFSGAFFHFLIYLPGAGCRIALTFLFIKPATKRDLLVNPIAAGTW